MPPRRLHSVCIGKRQQIASASTNACLRGRSCGQLGLIALLIGLSCHQLFADDLLGIPRPIDPQRPGALVLHGGGYITDEIFARFLESAGGSQSRIVFVPSAGYRREAFDSDEALLAALAQRYTSWMEALQLGKIGQLKFLFTDDPADADNDEFLEPLETATAVWFSGGDQARLNHRFIADNYPQSTKFQRLVAEVIARGGIVGGTSAGTAFFPEVMTIRSEPVNDTSHAPQRAVLAHGLGLLRGAIVEQHFDTHTGRLERFFNLLKDEERLDRATGRPGTGRHMLGLAVEAPAALWIQAGRLEAMGDASVHVFLKLRGGQTVVWHELQPGDTAQLRRLPSEDISLVPEETTLIP